MPQIHELTTNSSPTSSTYVAVDDGSTTKKATLKAIANVIYPVGSIYMSVNSTSPATLFGGTWSRIQDTFLLAAGSSYSAGSTGGEANHTLTESELPSLTGNFTLASNLGTNETGANTKWENATGKFSKVSRSNRNILKFNSGTYTVSTGQTLYDQVKWSIGSDGSHNNMPPYISVYMWQRVA